MDDLYPDRWNQLLTYHSASSGKHRIHDQLTSSPLLQSRDRTINPCCCHGHRNFSAAATPQHASDTDSIRVTRVTGVQEGDFGSPPRIALQSAQLHCCKPEIQSLTRQVSHLRHLILISTATSSAAWGPTSSNGCMLHERNPPPFSPRLPWSAEKERGGSSGTIHPPCLWTKKTWRSSEKKKDLSVSIVPTPVCHGKEPHRQGKGGGEQKILDLSSSTISATDVVAACWSRTPKTLSCNCGCLESWCWDLHFCYILGGLLTTMQHRLWTFFFLKVMHSKIVSQPDGAYIW